MWIIPRLCVVVVVVVGAKMGVRDGWKIGRERGRDEVKEREVRQRERRRRDENAPQQMRTPHQEIIPLIRDRMYLYLLLSSSSFHSSSSSSPSSSLSISLLSSFLSSFLSSSHSSRSRRTGDIKRRRQIHHNRRLLIPLRAYALIFANPNVLREVEVPDDLAGGLVDEDEGVAEVVVWVGREGGRGRLNE